jgi:hypothetical protein
MVRAFGLSGVLMVGVGRRVIVVGEMVCVGCDFGEMLPSGFEVGGGSIPDFDDARRKGLNRDSLRPDEWLWRGGDGDVSGGGVRVSTVSMLSSSTAGTSTAGTSVSISEGIAGAGRVDAS